LLAGIPNLSPAKSRSVKDRHRSRESSNSSRSSMRLPNPNPLLAIKLLPTISFAQHSPRRDQGCGLPISRSPASNSIHTQHGSGSISSRAFLQLAARRLLHIRVEYKQELKDRLMGPHGCIDNRYPVVTLGPISSIRPHDMIRISKYDDELRMSFDQSVVDPAGTPLGALRHEVSLPRRWP